VTEQDRSRGMIRLFWAGDNLSVEGATHLSMSRNPGRQTIVIGSHQIETISTSTPAQWHAFDLVGVRLDQPGADTSHTAGTSEPPAGQGLARLGRRNFGLIRHVA